MTRRLAVIAAMTFLFGCASCAATATFPAGILPSFGTVPDTAHVLTTTDLSKANYRVVRTGAKGKSQGLVLLLFFKVIPTSLSEAVDRLYEDAELAPGAAWALTNVMIEREGRNFLLFGLPRVQVRADVVEFQPVSDDGGGESHDVESASPPDDR